MTGGADEACDYLVIGAGSAGCVLAARLAEDRDARVFLAEAGPPGDWLLRIPGAQIRNSTTPKFNWSYRTEPEAELGGRTLFFAAGRVLGGSGAINGMVYARGHAGDYDGWRDAGCPGWGFEDVLPFFRASERNERGASRWHGDSGPLGVVRGRPPVPVCDAFLEAAAADGYRVLDDFNAGEDEGFGHYDLTVAGGRRASAASAFLAPPRANLAVRTGLHATRILIERGRAVGAEFAARDGRRVVRAAREVILAAGGINSPQLLMLSGIGPADALRAHGIAVAVDSPDVGRNLQNHASFRMQFACSKPVSGYAYLRPLPLARAALAYARSGTGILSQGPMPTGGFFRSDPALAVSDMQVHVSLALIGRVGGTVWQRLPREHGFSVSLNQGRPASRGAVTLRGADPRSPPRIAPRHFSEPGDLRTLAAGLERMRALLAAAPIASLIEREIGEAPRERAGLEAAIRRGAGTTFHPVGTCRMGGDARSVVDPELRVRGVEALRVADASIMPRIMNGNTNAPALMIGEKAAALIRAG